MPDAALRDLVLKRLDADATPANDWWPLVLAALDGPEELTKLLEAPSSRAAAPSSRAPSAATGGEGCAVSGPSGPPRVAFLKAVAVEGFRGIGPKAALDLTPGPGLTLVVGRNGSGKSSFAEALELDPKTFDAYMDAKLFLEKVLGHRVDLVLADAVEPRLRSMILAEAVHAPRL
jgi:hypothetical protein